jgi:hypothetical protein
LTLFEGQGEFKRPSGGNIGRPLRRAWSYGGSFIQFSKSQRRRNNSSILLPDRSFVLDIHIVTPIDTPCKYRANTAN